MPSQIAIRRRKRLVTLHSSGTSQARRLAKEVYDIWRGWLGKTLVDYQQGYHRVSGCYRLLDNELYLPLFHFSTGRRSLTSCQTQCMPVWRNFHLHPEHTANASDVDGVSSPHYCHASSISLGHGIRVR